MQQRVYECRINSVDELKLHLIDVRNSLQQNVIDTAINEWRKRLRACVHADGQHFEHLLRAHVKMQVTQKDAPLLLNLWLCGVLVSEGNGRTINRWGGISNHRSMAYLLSNICTNNYWNRTNIVEIIVGGWVVSFFETQFFCYSYTWCHKNGSILCSRWNFLEFS